MMDLVTAHLLYDYYGCLLTKRQQDIFEMRLFDDWSLGEIAEVLAISRQAVHDTMQRTIGQFEDYESKLGLLASGQKRRRMCETLVEQLIAQYEVAPDVVQSLRELAET